MSSLLYAKHLIATSALAPRARRVRAALARFAMLREPALGLLACEDAMMEAVFARLLAPDTNCIDVGAHVGTVSRIFAELAPRGRHLIIEPEAAKAAWLARRFPGAEVHAVAAAEADGERTLYQNLDNPGFTGLAPRKGRGRTRESRVRAVRLDSLVPADRRIGLLKIDVEGHEYAVLRGAEAILDRERPIIVFEAGATRADLPGGDPCAPLFRHLEERHDYVLRAVFDAYYARPPIDAGRFTAYRTFPYLAFNYVASPREGEKP